jgi:hypothetical protein
MVWRAVDHRDHREAAMTTEKGPQADKHREAINERSRKPDASRNTGRQIDDNQDDRGRDANDPTRISNEINKVKTPEAKDD